MGIPMPRGSPSSPPCAPPPPRSTPPDGACPFRFQACAWCPPPTSPNLFLRLRSPPRREHCRDRPPCRRFFSCTRRPPPPLLHRPVPSARRPSARHPPHSSL